MMYSPISHLFLDSSNTFGRLYHLRLLTRVSHLAHYSSSLQSFRVPHYCSHGSLLPNWFQALLRHKLQFQLLLYGFTIVYQVQWWFLNVSLSKVSVSLIFPLYQNFSSVYRHRPQIEGYSCITSESYFLSEFFLQFLLAFLKSHF